MLRPTRLVFAVVALLLATAGLSVASCKSNDIGITNNNSNEYQSSVTQKVDPATDTTVDGPDHSQAHFPVGALAATTSITIGKMKDGNYPNFPAGWVATGGVYSFEPHSSAFSKPVTIRVPFTDPGAGVRLVVSEPGGSWTPVDGAALAAGFATMDTPHFSFYTVVTGAPLDPTLVDAGVDATLPDDAGVDATIADTGTDSADAAGPDTAPLGPPTIFSLLLSGAPDISRQFIADAGEAGAFDGGTFALPSGVAIAYGAGQVFGLQYFMDGGAILPFNNPFGAMTQGTATALPTLSSAGSLIFFNGELWVTDGTTLSTYSTTGTQTFSQALSGVQSLHELTASGTTLSIVIGEQDQVQRYTVAGTGASKTVTPLGTPIVAGFPVRAIAATPWGDVLLASNTDLYRMDPSTGAVPGAPTYTINANQVLSLCATRVGGVDGLIVNDGELGAHLTYYFAPGDTNHTSTPTQGPSIPVGSATQVVVAP